jgi:hypothetical protein
MFKGVEFHAVPGTNGQGVIKLSRYKGQIFDADESAKGLRVGPPSVETRPPAAP